MSARVDSNWSYCGQPVIRIENAALAVDVIPTMGAKILNLIDKRGDRQVLWRNRHVPFVPGPLRADFDDYFVGGWDDAFPTGAPCRNEYGDELPYLGEIWNLTLEPRTIRSNDSGAAVELAGLTPVTPARWTRTISVDRDSPIVRLKTKIENVGTRSFDYCWGSHPAFAIGPGMRLDVPATEGLVTDAGAEGKLGSLGQHYRYPRIDLEAGESIDIATVDDRSLSEYALHALSGLAAGWCAATDPRARRGFGVVFDPSIHPCVWQWMSYGGLRGWYHAALEPWTSPAPDLAAAKREGSARTLDPGESDQTTMYGVIYAGVERVAEITQAGEVIGV